jgi:hypothetical protein
VEGIVHSNAENIGLGQESSSHSMHATFLTTTLENCTKLELVAHGSLKF